MRFLFIKHGNFPPKEIMGIIKKINSMQRFDIDKIKIHEIIDLSEFKIFSPKAEKELFGNNLEKLPLYFDEIFSFYRYGSFEECMKGLLYLLELSKSSHGLDKFRSRWSSVNKYGYERKR